MTVDRTRLPQPGPEPAFVFPEIRRHRLPNGLRVLSVEHRDVPLIHALVLVPSGAASDPEGRAGLAAITGDLLDEGCGDLDSLAFHDALARIGAQLDTEVGADATLLGITSLERFAPRALGLLADVASRPRLEPHEFARVRELRISRLRQLKELPPAIAERAFTTLLYGGHPYGHLPIGTASSLESMDAGDVRRFHAEAFQPRAVTVVVVGDAPHARLAELVEATFGTWRNADHAPAPGDAAAQPPPDGGQRRFAIVHRPGAAQTELRMGHVAVPRSTPDYHALLVLNAVLGGQFVSRINMNLRERRGYTYGVRTTFDFRRGPGPFLLQASVQSDATADAIREALHEIEAIRGDRPVSRAELELGRAGLTRGYPRNFETAEQVARAAAQLALYDLPADYFTTFVPRVLALTEADVTAAAARHIHPDRLVTAVVGDRDRFPADLSAVGAGREVEAVVEFA